MSEELTRPGTADHLDLAALHNALSACRLCQEAGHPIEPQPVFSGPPNARVMLIGQAPGLQEQNVRRPFNGDAGRRLFRWLQRAGWDERTFRETCYITAVTKCFPGRAKSGAGDRVPSAAEQKLCRPWLEAELRLIKPELIIPVGTLAIKLFYPPDVKLEEVIGASKLDEQGRNIVPLPHPSGASRWHNDPKNIGRIEQAIFHLRLLKQDLGL
jgi:uracil-DNA glycosylase